MGSELDDVVGQDEKMEDVNTRTDLVAKVGLVRNA
jgi:hypothetical protein